VDLANGHGKIGLKRNWNWPIWAGLVVAVGGLFSYEFFVQFPITRDFPWANLLLFGIGGALLIFGLFRAFGRPQLYRGKIFGSIFTSIALFLFAFSATRFFTSCARFRSPPRRRALAKRRRNSRWTIKTKRRSLWRICFPARELSR
jgi:hypothetical protein